MKKKFMSDEVVNNTSTAKNNIKDSFKKSELLRRVAAIGTAAAMIFSLPGCSSNENDSNSNEESLSIADVTIEDGNILIGGKSYAISPDLESLLKETNNSVQLEAMVRYYTVLYGFNVGFASQYLEDGKDIRAALSFDELSALDLVYNNYNKADIQAIYNGSEINSLTFDNNYKTGMLQLMGAYVIETRDNPVDISSLIVSDEGKAFYNKYHELFLQCKEAIGEDREEAIARFYAELYKDFPISDEEREVGIAHADSRMQIEGYKYSIIPMISAAEMMFQNIGDDKTLSDKAIEYFDDLGACNYARDVFERVEMITIVSQLDVSNPTYEDYRVAMSEYLTSLGAYVVDDSHRDLSQLDSFKEAVIGDLNFEISHGKFTGNAFYYIDQEKYVIFSRGDAVALAGEKAVSEAEAAADATVRAENEAARAEAEKEADIEAEKMQAEADQDGKNYEEQIANDQSTLESEIDNANQIIDQGGTVNSDDFSGTVNFDEDYTDENGNLDGSVQDLTTDPIGDQTGEPLPDPNDDMNAIVNEIVEAMAAPTAASYQEDVGYQYHK